jgi:hypothetical protein
MFVMLRCGLQGFIASANNRVTMPGFNYSIARDWDSGSDGYRAKRITQMILNKPKVPTPSYAFWSQRLSIRPCVVDGVCVAISR